MEKINIAELLKDCPIGTKLYSPLCGECEFDHIEYMGKIVCQTKKDTTIWFLPTGVYFEGYSGAECVLFPSKENRDWSKFQRPFKDGDVITCNNGACTFTSIFKDKSTEGSFIKYCSLILDDNRFTVGIKYADYTNPQFATEEEKQKLFDAIKANGYKWNAETKTLDKLPKFKDGDIVAGENGACSYITIFKEFIDNTSFSHYACLTSFGKLKVCDISDNKHLRLATEGEKEKLFQAIKSKGYKWNEETKTLDKLNKNKFDIANLKPFDKVLVRQNVHGIWGIDFFGFYNYDEGYYYTTGNCVYAQCIPYEQNKHLIGTTDDCDEYFKIWR